MSQCNRTSNIWTRATTEAWSLSLKNYRSSFRSSSKESLFLGISWSMQVWRPLGNVLWDQRAFHDMMTMMSHDDNDDVPRHERDWSHRDLEDNDENVGEKKMRCSCSWVRKTRGSSLHSRCIIIIAWLSLRHTITTWSSSERIFLHACNASVCVSLLYSRSCLTNLLEGQLSHYSPADEEEQSVYTKTITQQKETLFFPYYAVFYSGCQTGCPWEVKNILDKPTFSESLDDDNRTKDTNNESDKCNISRWISCDIFVFN